MISIDTETTGLDLRHGAKPFLVTTCSDTGEQRYWEWDVDPLTREPSIPKEDVKEIEDILKREKGWGKFDKAVRACHGLVLQNAKFDATALASIGIVDWPWEVTDDTLIAGHLLASNQPHDLTSMAIHYLGEDISKYEKKMEEAVKKCRSMVQQDRLRAKRGKETGKLACWRIGEEGLEEMPSAKESTWKVDSWLPKAMAKYQGLREPEDGCEHVWGSDWLCSRCEGHRWWVVTAEYANADSATTLALWGVLKREMDKKGYLEIYKEKKKQIRVLYLLEKRGVTVCGNRLEEQVRTYEEGSKDAAKVCVNIAARFDYDLKLPKSGNNRSLMAFCFGTSKEGHVGIHPLAEPNLNLPVVGYTDTGNPSLDKEAMDQYEGLLPAHSKQREFITTLRGKRKRDTAVQYMRGYQRFWLPLNTPGEEDWYILHPNVNPTGTDTLRLSSSNPNSQNISKKEGFNLRYCFGPKPGREWWAFDARNIERRIPAYEAGEEAIIELLERPDDPPYYGSEHALVAHLLFPKEFEQCVNDKGELDGRIFKKRFGSTLYDKTKRFNFAMQYNCGAPKADATSGLPGSHARFKSRFAKQEKLNQYWIRFAEQNGYVETMPDKSVDPTKGYPIMCTRTARGRIKPTTPLNYHVQGTACWWMIKAMNRCQDLLDSWYKKDRFDGFMTLTVHDELVFDFPRGKTRLENLPRARKIKETMELGGADFGIPIPVSMELHEVSYSEGVAV